MKKVLIFGGSGQIGRHLIRRLTNKNYLVTVVARNLHNKGTVLKLGGNPGYVEIIEANIFNEDKLNNLFKDKDICINLVGIISENKKNKFKNIHTYFPTLLSKKCEEFKLKQFIHISALGVDKAKDSKYAKSKLEGEKNILENFSKTNYKLDFKINTDLNVYELNLPAKAGENNLSKNKTYIDNLKVDSSAFNADENFVYITDIDIHDENLNVIASAKLAMPFAKKNTDNVLFRLKMDY